MEKEFIPYELAITLNEIGFDEPCFRGWSMEKQVFYHPDSDIVLDNPTFSQAFRFFREKYGYDYSIKPVYGEKHYRYYRVNIYVNEKLIQVMKYYFPDNPYFDNREEAELEALKKLIEIVKNK